MKLLIFIALLPVSLMAASLPWNEIASCDQKFQTLQSGTVKKTFSTIEKVKKEAKAVCAKSLDGSTFKAECEYACKSSAFTTSCDWKLQAPLEASPKFDRTFASKLIPQGEEIYLGPAIAGHSPRRLGGKIWEIKGGGQVVINPGSTNANLNIGGGISYIFPNGEKVQYFAQDPRCSGCNKIDGNFGVVDLENGSFVVKGTMQPDGSHSIFILRPSPKSEDQLKVVNKIPSDLDEMYLSDDKTKILGVALFPQGGWVDHEIGVRIYDLDGNLLGTKNYGRVGDYEVDSFSPFGINPYARSVFNGNDLILYPTYDRSGGANTTDRYMGGELILYGFGKKGERVFRVNVDHYLKSLGYKQSLIAGLFKEDKTLSYRFVSLNSNSITIYLTSLWTKGNDVASGHLIINRNTGEVKFEPLGLVTMTPATFESNSTCWAYFLNGGFAATPQGYPIQSPGLRIESGDPANCFSSIPGKTLVDFQSGQKQYLDGLNFDQSLRLANGMIIVRTFGFDILDPAEISKITHWRANGQFQVSLFDESGKKYFTDKFVIPGSADELAFEKDEPLFNLFPIGHSSVGFYSIRMTDLPSSFQMHNIEIKRNGCEYSLIPKN